MATAEITKATKEDVEALVQLVNSAYRGDASKKGWTTEADLLDGIRIDTVAMEDLLHQPGSALLKYTDNDGRIKGCVYLQQKYEELYLGMLTVSPEAQAGGTGKKLLAAAEEHAVQHHCLFIVMTVISVRHELILWYQRHGYEKTAETKPFPNDPRFGIPKQPLEFVVLKKMLPGSNQASSGTIHP